MRMIEILSHQFELKDELSIIEQFGLREFLVRWAQNYNYSDEYNTDVEFTYDTNFVPKLTFHHRFPELVEDEGNIYASITTDNEVILCSEYFEEGDGYWDLKFRILKLD